MALDAAALVKHVQSGLAPLANAENALAMQAYCKTEMPFYGVKKPERAPTIKVMNKAFNPETLADYKAGVRALWAQPHREEKYMALSYADRHRAFHVPEAMDLFEQLIREGQWWDLIDIVATNMVGTAFKRDRQQIKPVMLAWNDDDDLWIRRSSILSQNRHKAETDARLLFKLCLARAGEKDFFIRKAIGWALRDYAKTEPVAVAAFVLKHREVLSGLSVREAAKQLRRSGHWDEA